MTAAMGGLGLVAPALAAALVGLEARTLAGGSEFRATYGGLFLALGAAPLMLGEPLLYAAAALAWLGAGLGRRISIAIDRAANTRNWLAAAFETAVGAALIAGSPAAGLIDLAP